MMINLIPTKETMKQIRLDHGGLLPMGPQGLGQHWTAHSALAGGGMIMPLSLETVFQLQHAMYL